MIQQRLRHTILRVQRHRGAAEESLLCTGEPAMRPLVLVRSPTSWALHESTISRVLPPAYMSTPFGTVELPGGFFGSALGTETGGNASSTAVRALIKQFVGSESTKKPLSDSQISEDAWREQGIECARRTVAKYREAAHRAGEPAQGAVGKRVSTSGTQRTQGFAQKTQRREGQSLLSSGYPCEPQDFCSAGVR